MKVALLVSNNRMKVALLVFSCLLFNVGARKKPMLYNGERRRDLLHSSIRSLLATIPFRKGYSLDNCPVNSGRESCWADSAKAKCIGLNMTTDEIHSKVMAAAPDLRTMHALYRRCAGAAVIKSECTKGHGAIRDYEDVRHQCRHLLASRPK